ncbi:hypothetical protein ABLV17_07375 [Klebsiella sp. CN_Kp091]|uniref:hypothetical protein n=1 Tax=unclassified Klebsiella TaxID=2608929 RepID=UPI0032B4B9DB
MAKDPGVTLVSIAKSVGVSTRSLNQIMQSGPSEKQIGCIAEAGMLTLGSEPITITDVYNLNYINNVIM